MRIVNGRVPWLEPPEPTSTTSGLFDDLFGLRGLARLHLEALAYREAILDAVEGDVVFQPTRAWMRWGLR